MGGTFDILVTTRKLYAGTIMLLNEIKRDFIFQNNKRYRACLLGLIFWPRLFDWMYYHSWFEIRNRRCSGHNRHHREILIDHRLHLSTACLLPPNLRIKLQNNLSSITIKLDFYINWKGKFCKWEIKYNRNEKNKQKYERKS